MFHLGGMAQHPEAEGNWWGREEGLLKLSKASIVFPFWSQNMKGIGKLKSGIWAEGGLWEQGGR